MTGTVVIGATFVRTYGWGVETGASAFEVCTIAATCKAGLAGNGAGQFATSSPTDLAIDSENNVFALDGPTNKRVEEFSSTPALVDPAFGVASLTAAFGTGVPTAITVDAADHVYIAGPNSANASKIAVLEMDHTGVALATHGTDLAPTVATGLAVTKASLSGNIYVASNNSGHRVYVLNEGPKVEAASSIGAHGATLNGQVVSNNLEVKYHFEYSTDGVTWVSAPASDATVAATPGAVLVQQALTGLLANTKYFVRLVATRPVGGFVITSARGEFTTLGEAPLVNGTLSGEVNDTSARLISYLNANHQETAYNFEFGTDTSYGTSIPIPDGSAGAGTANTMVSQELTGLKPATTYHFRVVASNATGPVVGPDRTFTTRLFPVAPEGRVYEVVTPLDKNGGSQEGASVLDNNHVYFNSTIAYEPEDTGVYASGKYLGVRSSTGWKRVSGNFLTQPIPSGAPALIQDFNADESQFIVQGNYPLVAEDNDNGRIDVYTKTAAGFTLISKGSTGGNGEFKAGYAGQSKDGSHILFQTREVLEPADTGRVTSTQPELYERFNGQTRVVALDSAGNPIGTGGALLGNGKIDGGSTGAVSADGSRVFFEAPCPAGFGSPVYEDPACATPPPGEPTQLYVRENAQTTVNVGLPERTTPGNAPQTTIFQGATPDGSKVLFTTTAQLVDGDTDTSSDLYLYDFDAPVGHRLTRVSGGASGTGVNADVIGVSTITNDARRIYFSANGVVAPGGTAGAANLYQYDGQENSTKFVVTLAAVEGGDAYSQRGLFNGPSGISLTPDGATAVFTSQSRLTDYQNNGVSEIYLYRAASGAIECVSCNPTGEPPFGSSGLGLARHALLIATHQNHLISDDGSTVAFQSSDALVPQDINHKQDVYVWHEGKLSLITLGTGPAGEKIGGVELEPSAVGGITPDGQDIFFSTADRLVSSDTDTLGDIYDARINGGFNPQGAIPPCSDDSCQGQPLAAPEVVVPGSAAYNGGGNVRSPKPKKCAKGAHKINGKCVKSKKRHKKKAKHASRQANSGKGARSGS